MAPEVLARTLNPSLATKVKAEPLASWGLGALMYEILTMCPFPFREPVCVMEDNVPKLMEKMMHRFNTWVRPCLWEPDSCNRQVEHLVDV